MLSLLADEYESEAEGEEEEKEDKEEDKEEHKHEEVCVCVCVCVFVLFVSHTAENITLSLRTSYHPHIILLSYFYFPIV